MTPLDEKKRVILDILLIEMRHREKSVAATAAEIGINKSHLYRAIKLQRSLSLEILQKWASTYDMIVNIRLDIER